MALLKKDILLEMKAEFLTVYRHTQMQMKTALQQLYLLFMILRRTKKAWLDLLMTATA